MLNTDKVYECLIIGATFTAMGLAQILRDECLIAESGLLVGYEFFNSLNFGENFEKEIKNEQSCALKRRFRERGVFDSKEAELEKAADIFYSLLKDKNVLLNTSVTSIKRNNDMYCVEIFGASGFRNIFAKKIINTAIQKDNIKNIFYNIVADNEKIKLPIKENDFTAARTTVDAFLKKSGKRLLYTADCFEYRAKRKFYREEGITYITSCGFDNPIEAFDCGITFAKTGDIK